ncbi:hypothetical protein TrST_g7924 [Triparma strigata]|uniref:Uncharacterized protein n=1 Tax=Triparma strigata TaxID=1606541 RepID=A0A9W7BSX7_9STRA|nr:hypothetical protein TrST_g7924 [Triparma strigata]
MLQSSSADSLPSSRRSKAKPNHSSSSSHNPASSRRPLPTPKARRQVAVPANLTYKLKLDSPFQHYTVRTLAQENSINNKSKLSSAPVSAKLLANPILKETKKIDRILNPLPDPKFYDSFLKTTIPKPKPNAWEELELTDGRGGLEPTPLEIQINQSYHLRSTYLERLHSLTTRSARNSKLLKSTSENIHTLTESAQILLVEISDLLTLIRHSTIEYVENVTKWRTAHNKVCEPYLVNGKNPMAQMSYDLNFLDEYSLLRKWLGTRMTRNPLVLRNGLDERLESIRQYEGLTKIMDDVKFVDDGKDKDEEEPIRIVNDNGVVRSGGLIERMRLENEREKWKKSHTSHQDQDQDQPGQMNSEVAVKIAETSLTENKPSDIAALAIKEATLTLARSDDKDAYDKIPSPTKHAKTMPNFYKNATTVNNPSALIALRFLSVERTILHEEGLEGAESLMQSLKVIEKVPRFVAPKPPPHYPFGVEEDKIANDLANINSSLAVHAAHALKVEATIKRQVAIIPGLRLQLWWSRRLKQALEEQERGGGVDVVSSKGSSGLGVLEKMPWATGVLDPEFRAAWNRSKKFRRKMEFAELLRLERLAFVKRLNKINDTIETTEQEIAGLQGIIASTVHELEDHKIKCETLLNRRSNVTEALDELIEKRRANNKGRDDKWVATKRYLLPMPYGAILLDKNWEADRKKEFHSLNWWLDRYTRPTNLEPIELTYVQRNYAKPWQPDFSYDDEEPDFEELAKHEEAQKKKEKAKEEPELVGGHGLQRTIGKSKNKFACYTVYRGGFRISKILCMVHVIRKPPKGYSMGGYIVSCFCTRVGKRSGKLSDLNEVVNQMFVGDVLKVFAEHYPMEITGKEDEAHKWRKWCRHLKLARPVLPDGRVSGRVKLVWNIKSTIPGEIYQDLLEEGELEKSSTRCPTGTLFKTCIKLNVMSEYFVDHNDEESVEGDGMKAGDIVTKSELGVELPPSRVLSYVGVNFYFVKVVGYNDNKTGYDLPGFNVELHSSLNLQQSVDLSKVSWNRFKELGWDEGKLGKKEAKDIVKYLKSLVVIRNSTNGHEYIDNDNKENKVTQDIYNDYTTVYKSDDDVVNGKSCMISVVGSNDRFSVDNNEFVRHGRGHCVKIKVTLVWNGELVDLQTAVSLSYLKSSGYKCGYRIADSGDLDYFIEMRHISKLKNNLCFVYDDGNLENVRLQFVGHEKIVFKKCGYVGGEFVCMSICYDKGRLNVKCLRVRDSHLGRCTVDEEILVRKGWLELARQVSNASDEGLKVFMEALGWTAEGELYLSQNEAVADDEDVSLGQCLLKSALRVDDQVYFVKCSTFTYRERRMRLGDDGLVFDIFPRNPGEDEEGGWEDFYGDGIERKRAVIPRDELQSDYGVQLLRNGGIGKSLNRLPKHTLFMILGILRQNAYGQSSR